MKRIMNWTVRFNIIAWLAFLLMTACRYDPIPGEVHVSIDEVLREYAPDKRVALFDVEAQAQPRGLVLSGATNMEAAKSALLGRLEAQGISAVDEIEVLPSEELGDYIYGVVRLSVCNIRSEARHSAELSTQATLGALLRVHKEEEGWFLVQTPDDYFGWIDAGGFALMTAAEYEAWKAADKVVYLPDFGFSLVGPEAGAPPVSDLLAGNILRLVAVEEPYARVAYPDGREAFVPAADVMNYDRWLATREPAAEAILGTARTFLGRPYLWGGTSGKGVDCSGFTKTVFYLNGLLLPRDASQQVQTGVDISTDTTFSSLQPGDLLFFGRKAAEEQPEKIVHVAIYMGDGRIIHSAGTVKINSLRRSDPDFNEYRLNTFVRAKRLLSSIGENGVQRLEETAYY
jgi:hypothetical protein